MSTKARYEAKVDPHTLKADPRNPRKIDDDAKQRLKAGIEAFGFVDPVIARSEDKMILGGHQRVQLAVEMGVPHVPVIFVSDLDDNKAAALNILLNNPNAQGDWDYRKLTGLLSDLDASGGIDATITGFDLEELERLLVMDWKPITEPLTDAVMVSAQQLNKEAERIANRFDAYSDSVETVKVACPHCANEFEVTI